MKFYVLLGAAFLLSIAILGLTAKPMPYQPVQCPRSIPGYELLAFKTHPNGDEYDCRFVKRAVR